MTTWPPEAWVFTDDRLQTCDVLYLDPEQAKRAAVKAFLSDALNLGKYDWRPVPGRGHAKEQELHRNGRETGFRVAVQPWVNVRPDSDQCAWHDLRIHDAPDSFTGERAEVTCPDECRRMPPGAVCWYIHEPWRAEWPTGPGTYRIRPYHHTVQRGEDGDAEVEFQVLTWTAAAWLDRDGRAVPEADGRPF